MVHDTWRIIFTTYVNREPYTPAGKSNIDKLPTGEVPILR